tara:strand:+ start:7883 stop:8638 length:756 start_codon:yes stop_codon:yes gene_type:complete
MANKKTESKFPSEIIDLPSGGKLYADDHPLRGGKIEIKYMTAKEEDILTSQNLIKKGVVIDRLLESLILTDGVSVDDMFTGDKNAVMIAVRILAYGPNYEVEILHPDTSEKVSYTFDLSSLDYKQPSDEIVSNEFEFELPVSKNKVVFKLLTGKDERNIDKELKSLSKLGTGITREMTTRYKNQIISVNGDVDKSVINDFVDSMLSKDSLSLRKKMNEITPDIDLTQQIELGGDEVTVEIPMTVDFFWPSV